jgi:hypothetical protein
LVGKIEEVTRRDGELLVRLSDHRLADEWVPAAALKPEASPAAVARADLGQGGAIAREVRSRAGELANGRVRSDALCQRDQRLLSLLRRVARGDRLDFPLPTGQPCHVPLEATRVVLLGEEVSGGP